MVKKRLLIIDGQVFQTAARDRGMGRYSEKLISSLLSEKHYDNIQLILNKNLQPRHTRNNTISDTLQGVEIVYLNLAETTKKKIEVATVLNKKEINNYISNIASKENKDIDFLIPSPFQEPVVSIFPDNVNKILVFYDLIPYLYFRRYQPLMQFENYLKRFNLMFEADVILAISKSVRDDLMVYLGISSERVVSIDGAAIKSGNHPVKPELIDIPSKFILMPTSDDPRKNNMRAVLGFEEFRSEQTEDYKLVITSKIHEGERSRLKRMSNNIIFTGNINEAELDWLYNECQAVLFVPESEGLGLPILEAVLANKRVICSSINVFKEISKDAFYYCDFENHNSIADAITLAIADKELSLPTSKYKAISDHYSWPQTARRSIKAINNIKARIASKRPKIAIFSPISSGLSAVGKVVAETHPVLNEYFDIDYYIEPGQYPEITRPNYLPYIANCFPAESFCVERYKQYEAVIYHIGNSDYHIESIKNSLYLPGYVILHDTNISEAYRIMHERGMISTVRKDLESLITQSDLSDLSSHISSVVNCQLGILTHSKYAASATKDVLASGVNDDTVIDVNLATRCPILPRQKNYDLFTIGLAGIIADIKGIEVIESLANNPVFDDCKFSLFGYNYATQETINRLMAYSNVNVSTNLTDFDFYNNIGKLDIFVNYRMKYQGEASLSTLEAMRQGVVVIVRNIGWYSELPDNAVIKVDNEKDVADKLIELRFNPIKMSEVSKNAKSYVKNKCSHMQYAEGIKKIIDKVNNLETDMHYVSNELKHKDIRKSSQLIELYKNSSLRGKN